MFTLKNSSSTTRLPYLRLSYLIGAFLLCLISVSASAEQKLIFGEYEVHYMGLSSSFLTPEVAKIYDIPRSGSLGFLNISVLQKAKGSQVPAAVDANVKGIIRNLIGQSRELEFRRIREGQAIYYISTFRFDDGDMYNFDLDIVPTEAKQKNFDVKFSQRFYEEE
ncbi:MAG: DUF4426 domain-containing protein [Oleispira sp.]|nr:DUF4426 domain-containing protein [Oleispira sp.]MBL4882512.1 DUF4426 domain-containing protein [Oleispira sp.]